MKVRALMLCSILLSGCATQVPDRLTTASGKPEVTINDVTKADVIASVVEHAMSGDGIVKSVNDHEVVIVKKIEGNFLASFLYGSRYDSNPEVRLHLNFVQSGKAVKLYARAGIVTNPGSAFERTTDITAAQGSNLQERLENVRARFNQASAASSPAPLPQTPVTSLATTTPTPQYGELSGSVERIARQNGCAPAQSATLIGKTTGIETYQVTCESGQQALFKCELRQCRMMN